MKDGQTSFTVEEEETMELPLIFEPKGENEEDQPSQTAMRWTYDKEGIVNIKQSRGQYDRYASKTFVLTAVSEGNVEVTGTPLIAKEGGSQLPSLSPLQKAAKNLQIQIIW